jgi:hypothetical protein
MWDDRVGNCRQEIAVIGLGLNRAFLERQLDRALPTSAEQSLHPDEWTRFPDPLP